VIGPSEGPNPFTAKDAERVKGVSPQINADEREIWKIVIKEGKSGSYAGQVKFGGN
jgi:hypothetical protein